MVVYDDRSECCVTAASPSLQTDFLSEPSGGTQLQFSRLLERFGAILSSWERKAEGRPANSAPNTKFANIQRNRAFEAGTRARTLPALSNGSRDLFFPGYSAVF